jgi:Second Messenger Oligonucleotide or Dinucleotide Synthetase domain
MLDAGSQPSATVTESGACAMNYVAERTQLRQSQLVALIEDACAHLEPSSYQRDLAKQRYEGVGDWLARSDDWLLASIAIGLQGSVAIGTTVKPIGANEYDVDLIAHVPDLDVAVSPALLKKRIGDRLRSNGNYGDLLIEMPRCWRLDYANEFHLDITPSIPNPECRFGGELVPDKTLKTWKASNPKGYRAKFERRAALQPRIRALQKAFDSARADVQVEPYPDEMRLKGILRRTVQIAKRHRDLHFIDDSEGLVPLSIIITTLASRAYEFCVSNFEYDNELTLIVDVLRRMPDMLETGVSGGRPAWFLWNQTTAGENFCEKWNREPRRAEAFFAWHAKALSDLTRLAAAHGLDEVRHRLSNIFGTAPANKAMDSLTERVSAARAASRLSVTRPVGVTVGTASGATQVRANTFFGGDR